MTVLMGTVERPVSKSKPLKLPKRIGGVKMPKFLREPGAIERLLDHPIGRRVLAEALRGAATALEPHDNSRADAPAPVEKNDSPLASEQASALEGAEDRPWIRQRRRRRASGREGIFGP